MRRVLEFVLCRVEGMTAYVMVTLSRQVQAGLATTLEKLQAMAPVDEAMAHRATYIMSKIVPTPREPIAAF